MRRGQSDNQPHVSIVIPARNEEKLLPRCVESILAQEGYPSDRIQIIIVDDCSYDRTHEIALDYKRCDPRIEVVQVLDNPKGYSPKKNALDQGFGIATGDIFLPMDADCEANPRWLASIVRSFEPYAVMVSGYAELDRPNLAEPLLIRIQSLEFLSLIACAAGSTSMGWYLASSGANQGYLRKTWEEIGGFGEIGSLVSGDDDLMLQRISKISSGKIVFCGETQCCVLTEPMRSVREFYEQRKRWGSKYTYHRTSYKVFLSLFYIYNLLLFVSPMVALATPNVIPTIIFILTIKWCSEYMLLTRAMRLFNRKDLFPFFPVWAILHVPYIALMGPVGLFMRVVWKERVYNNRSRMFTKH